MIGIELDHVGEVARLSFHHRDAFDRLLAAQALVKDATIVSFDPVFKRYGVKSLW